MNKTIQWMAVKQQELAMMLYNRYYDNHLYQRATAGKSSKYANALMNDAMALCGSPYYKVSRRNWNSKAVDFLYRFAMQAGKE